MQLDDKVNYYEWLKTIPLASTAAGITPSPEPQDLAWDGSETGYGATRRYVRAMDVHTPPKPPLKSKDGNPFKQFMDNASGI